MDTADGALTRGRLRGPAPPVRARHGRLGQVAGAHRGRRLARCGARSSKGPADRTAGPLEWPASDARSLVLELAGDAPLVELVTIRQLRRKRIVRDGDTRVELSLDEVDVVSRSRVVDRFVELEAELVKGAEERLAGWPRSSPRIRRSSPASGSKLEAALAAVRLAGGRVTALADDLDDDGGRGRPDVGRRRGCDAERPGGATKPVGRHEREARPRGKTAAAAARRTAARRIEHSRRHADLVGRRQRGRRRGDRRRQRASSSARPRASPPRTTSPRPAARSCASTSPGCSPARPAPAREAIPRSSTRCASRPAANARPGGSSAPRSGPGRTKRYRNGLREIASRLGAVRDLDVLLDAADAYRADLPVSRAAGARAAAGRLARASRRRPGPPDPRARLGRLPALGRRLPRFRADRGRGRSCRSARPSRIASAIPPRRRSGRRTSRSAATSRSCAGPTSRRSTSCGSPGKWLRYTLEFVREALGDDAAPLIARVTALQDHLGLMNDANVSASMARTFLVEHAGELSRARKRGDRALPGQPRARGRPPAAVDRRAVARRRGRHVPAHARAGRRRAVGRAVRRGLGAPAVGEVGQSVAPGRPAVVDREDDALRGSRPPRRGCRPRRSGRGWRRGSRHRPAGAARGSGLMRCRSAAAAAGSVARIAWISAMRSRVSIRSSDRRPGAS